MCGANQRSLMHWVDYARRKAAHRVDRARICRLANTDNHLYAGFRLKISIITAVYNGESAIVPTLDSVAAQDHQDLEHIVIDGGSGDATVALVHQHGLRVSKYISERDRGVYDAFNKGLRIATGDAIAFLNAGDTYLNGSVVSRMAGALTSTGVDAAFADTLIVDRRDEQRILRRYSSRLFTPERMRFGLMPAHPSLFMRRAIYERIGE